MNNQPNEIMTHLTSLHLPPPLALEPTKNDEQHLPTHQNPSPKPCQAHDNDREAVSEGVSSSTVLVLEVMKEAAKPEREKEEEQEDNGRERLQRHRVEVAGRVWIPDIWGQEEMLKDWIDCSAFEASLVTSNILSARAALAQEGRRASSGGLRIENRGCSEGAHHEIDDFFLSLWIHDMTRKWICGQKPLVERD